MAQRTKPGNKPVIAYAIAAGIVIIALIYSLSSQNVLGRKHNSDTGKHTTANYKSLPEFPGGQEAWQEFVGSYEYPPEAIEHGVSGKVIVQFVVEKNGRLTDIKVLRDPGLGTAEAAVKLFKRSPNWKPGVQDGKPVRVAYTQAISLNIDSE